MPRLIYIICLFAILSGCGSGSRPSAEDQSQAEATESHAFHHPSLHDFYGNLKSLCGNTFEGKQIYMQPGRESWENKRMIMQVTVCDQEMIHIPFHLDEDRSRTWMFFNEDGRLRFRHDHRHEDGTPEDMTMYGGYAVPARGTAYYQVFPADDYTIDIHPITIESEWVVELNEDLSLFSYQLHHQGAMIFRADFDLTKPL